MKEKYFGPEVDQAIIAFKNSNDLKEKQQLVKDKIWPAFEKLATFYFHRLPVRKNEEMIGDCIVHLYEAIPMFNPSSASTGFSYFNMVARNFVYQRLKHEKREVGVEKDTINICDAVDNRNLIDDNLEKNLENREFVELFKDQLEKWQAKATKENEKIVINALLVIFNNAANIDIYKKKAIFFYIKEMTGLNAKQVSSTLNKLNKKFKGFKEKYLKGDI